MNKQTEEQAELQRRVHVIACAALGLDDEDHEDDELAEPLEKAIFSLLAKQKEKWEKDYQRREDESNLAMLTWLMDERSERMYMGDGKMKGNYWLCNAALTAVATNKIEAERRKLIAHLSSKGEKE
jgi:hypothetical protein